MDDDYDFWTKEPRTKPLETAPVLAIETIAGIEPLNVQFGVATPLTVPAVLQDVLFGQPDPTEAEFAAHGGDPARVPPLQTCAILDAAKVQGLPEMLEASGLPHRCLFKGAAYDDLKDAAPWVIQLKDGSSFTRSLFPCFVAGWHLWGKEPGIFVRSRASLDEQQTLS